AIGNAEFGEIRDKQRRLAEAEAAIELQAIGCTRALLLRGHELRGPVDQGLDEVSGHGSRPLYRRKYRIAGVPTLAVSLSDNVRDLQHKPEAQRRSAFAGAQA